MGGQGAMTPQAHILNAEAMLVSGFYREAAEEAGCVLNYDPALVSKHQRLRAYAVRMASLYEDQRFEILPTLFLSTKDTAMELPPKQFAVWAVMCVDVGLQTGDEELQLLSKQCTENYIENLHCAADTVVETGQTLIDEDLSLVGGVYAVEILAKGLHRSIEARSWIGTTRVLIPEHKKILCQQLDTLSHKERLQQQQQERQQRQHPVRKRGGSQAAQTVAGQGSSLTSWIQGLLSYCPGLCSRMWNVYRSTTKVGMVPVLAALSTFMFIYGMLRNVRSFKRSMKFFWASVREVIMYAMRTDLATLPTHMQGHR